MPGNIDARPRHRRQAISSAAFCVFWQLATAAILLWARSAAGVPPWLGLLLTACAVIDLGLLIPLEISLKQRLNEIEGGEEDEALQY